MGSDLMARRVHSDVEVLARAGLDTATFVEELDASLQRAVPHVGACIVTTDPATRLPTATYKFGDLVGRDRHDHEWGIIEFGTADPTSFLALADSDVPAASVGVSTGGDLSRCARTRDFITPYFGYGDELRMVGRQAGSAWGGVALFREAGDEPFSTEEVGVLAALSEPLAAGLRAGLLARTLGVPQLDHLGGPAVLIVGADGRPASASVGVEQVLAELASDRNMAPIHGIVGGLVAGARRYAAGDTTVLPRTRLRLLDGRWLVLHASPLSGLGGSTGEVVITIEEARPPEIVPLVVAAFELTARERDVTQLVLQGLETKEIAAALHMSRYTVQDHLKSVFDKAGVRSRRELVSRVYFDQYVPRMGSELAPSGWFAGPAGELSPPPG